MPNVFFYGKNYSTPFCQNKDEDDCTRKIFRKMIETTQKDSMKTCKHSCNILQYSGVVLGDSMLLPKDFHEQKTKNVYRLFYDFGYGDNAPPHQVPKLLFVDKI